MGKSSLSKSVLKPKVLVFLDAITSLALFSVTITISHLKPLTHLVYHYCNKVGI